jgi:membrane fusion protein, multidrug efflux system
MASPIQFLIVATLAVAGCSRASGDPAPADPEPVLVRLAPVTHEVIAVPVVGTGTLQPREEVPLSFKVGGIVSRILVDPGVQVRAGDRLAALDQTEINVAVIRARSAAEKAERDAARAGRLYADSVFTLAQLQDAETAVQMARADLQAALFNRRYSVIASPAAGVILQRRAEPGELVTPGMPILVLGSRARGSIVRVGLADRDVVRLHRGDQARVTFDALPDRDFAGRISEIAAAADPMTGTYAIEVSITNAPALASGLVGRVEIQPAAGKPATLIPIEAVLEADGAQATVYTISPDRPVAERRRITIAFMAQDRVAVAGGLDGVSRVVTEGAAYLRDGVAVREAL